MKSETRTYETGARDVVLDLTDDCRDSWPARGR